MAFGTLRRLHHGADDAWQQLTELRNRLSLQAEVVTPRSRQLTQKVFGEPLTATQVVERICAQVRQRGLEAALEYTEQLDGVRLTRDTVRVRADELAAAHKTADAAFLETVRRVRNQIW